MDEPQATVSGPGAPKKRRGRPPGIKRKTTDRELIEALARQVDALKVELDKKTQVPAAAQLPQDNIPPGTIMVMTKDPQTGHPLLVKKPWTRGDMDRTYPKVTFTPSYTMPITVNRVTVELESGKEITCPSVFKDEYERLVRIQHPNTAAMFPGPTPDQQYRQREAARRQAGVRVFTGLSYLGTGLDVRGPEAPEPHAEESQ